MLNNQDGLENRGSTHVIFFLLSKVILCYRWLCMYVGTKYAQIMKISHKINYTYLKLFFFIFFIQRSTTEVLF